MPIQGITIRGNNTHFSFGLSHQFRWSSTSSASEFLGLRSVQHNTSRNSIPTLTPNEPSAHFADANQASWSRNIRGELDGDV